MDQGIATQLVTAGATLGGVILTLCVNAFLERRRAHDTRWLESLRAASQHAVRLRDERQKAYAQLSSAGEDVVQFIRTEMPPATDLDNPTAVGTSAARAHWHQLRTELRKAYNRVELFGSDAVRESGARIWQSARNGLNDVFAALEQQTPPSNNDVAETLRSIASQLGSAGGPYMQACRQDLQRSKPESYGTKL